MTWQRSGCGRRRMSRSRMNCLIWATVARASRGQVLAAGRAPGRPRRAPRAMVARRPSASSGGKACFGKVAAPELAGDDVHVALARARTPPRRRPAPASAVRPASSSSSSLRANFSWPSRHSPLARGSRSCFEELLVLLQAGRPPAGPRLSAPPSCGVWPASSKRSCS